MKHSLLHLMCGGAWALQLWLFVMLIFCPMREQFRFMARRQMIALFFSRPGNACAPTTKEWRIT